MNALVHVIRRRLDGRYRFETDGRPKYCSVCGSPLRTERTGIRYDAQDGHALRTRVRVLCDDARPFSHLVYIWTE